MSARPAVAQAVLQTLDARVEALRILSWWAAHTVDEGQGGFYGEVDAQGRPVPEADKGAVLNCRLLWFFSAVAHRYGRKDALGLARRAFDYLLAHVLDPDHGGVYWSVDALGRIADARKQAYAQAFFVYALCEYYAATQDPLALDLARRLRDTLETVFWDVAFGGYVEAKSRDWGDFGDQRLSERDLDCPKTMNTHLHILEAYTRLYQVAPDAAAREALLRVTELFLTRFIDAAGRHLTLFFDMDWTDRTRCVSYGHDIEASWLIWEAVETLGDAALTRRARPIVLGLGESCRLEGLVKDALAYERGFAGHLDEDGEWWEQAEGLVGFVNAWQLTGDDAYAAAANRLWTRITEDFNSGAGGEWTWYATHSPKPVQPLVSLWKCPYHNGRAMLELDRRLKPFPKRGMPFSD